MKPRQILIVAGVAIAAFAAALAISGAGGDGEPKAEATSAKPAEVIDLEQATVSARVPAPAGLPGLRVPKPKKDEPDESPGTTGDPSVQTTPQPDTTPQPQQDTTPPPQTPQPTPTPDDEIVTGGGEINVGGGED